MLLVYLQIKHRRSRNDVVKDVALDFLVVGPLLIAAEGVDLQRHAKLRRLQLSHHHGEVMVQLRVIVEIGLDVGAEDAEVGLLATVHDLARVDVVGLVVFEDVFFFLGDVVLYQRIMLIFLQHLGRAVANGVHVDVDAAGDASSTRLRHASPVGEGSRNQRVGRDGSDGVIPVLHLHRSEVDFLHSAVGLSHHDPVADAEHVVDRQLYAAHKAFDRVLEDEQEHGRDGAQSDDDAAEALAQEESGDKQHTNSDDDAFDDLYQTFDGF